jgi:hypothetical protein
MVSGVNGGLLVNIKVEEWVSLEWVSLEWVSLEWVSGGVEVYQ